MDIASLFSGLKDAKVYEQGVFLDPGNYELEIVSCLAKETRAGQKAFIVETKILASDNAKFPVGSKATWFQGFKEPAVAFAQIKLFMYALLKKDLKSDKEFIEKNVDPNIESMMVQACEKNALKGQKVRVQMVPKKTKAGKEINIPIFSPAE